MLNIVADNNICELYEYFANLGNIKALPGRSITSKDLIDAQILLVRSVTQVDKKLLENTKVKFVGTLTSGTDHIDIAYLTANNIKFAHAKGSNAQAVVEYVIAAINFITKNNQPDLAKLTVGIVGVGNIGLRLHYVLSKLGIKTLLTDPYQPKYNNIALKLNYIPLTTLLTQADIVSFHCPLTTTAVYPTYQMLNSSNLNLLKPNSWIINTARGAIIDADGLLNFIAKDNKLNFIFDVWQHEPIIDNQILAGSTIATPHIAGYSYNSKLRGTQVVQKKLINYLTSGNLQNDNSFWDKFTSKPVNNTAINNILQSITAKYNLLQYSFEMKAKLNAINNANIKRQIFDQLRKQHAQKREFGILDFITELNH